MLMDIKSCEARPEPALALHSMADPGAGRTDTRSIVHREVADAHAERAHGLHPAQYGPRAPGRMRFAAPSGLDQSRTELQVCHPWTGIIGIGRGAALHASLGKSLGVCSFPDLNPGRWHWAVALGRATAPECRGPTASHTSGRNSWRHALDPRHVLPARRSPCLDGRE